MDRWVSRGFLYLTLAAAAGGCTAGRPTAEAPDVEEDGGEPTPAECLVDRDGDGYGYRCPAGPDCDDLDPSRATECGAEADACEPGDEEPCFKVEGAEGTTLRCGVGTRSCDANGLWGYCDVTDEFEQEMPAGALSSPPVPCNPCNPGCAYTEDLPDDTDIVPGTNAEDVEYDSGRGGIVLDDGLDDGPGDRDADDDGTPDEYDIDPHDPLVDGYKENGDRFFVLPFGGAVEVGEFDVKVEVRSADVYFLMDTTGSMQGEIDNLRESLVTGNFINDPALCDLDASVAPVQLRDWEAEYFDNRHLTPPARYTRVDPRIAFDWGSGRPGPSMPSNHFSVRWSKTVDLANDTVFDFELRTDDGMRIRVDGVEKWQSWRNQGPTRYTPSITVPAGVHVIAIEYYEYTGGALAEASGVGKVPAPAGYEGLIGAIRCQIADPAFGIGYFDDYPIARYGYSLGDGACNDPGTGTFHDLPFVQLAGSTLPSDLPTLQAAVGDLAARCGDDIPESYLQALWAVATGGGLPDSQDGAYATGGPVGFMDGGDPLATPSVPAPDGSTGPGGWVVDFDAGDVTTVGKVFVGDTTGEASDHAGACNASDSAPDHVYRFELTARTRVVASTIGSSFDTAVTVYDAAGTRRGCDDVDGGTYATYPTLDPGTYYAVVDGNATGKEGLYRLYVGPVVGDDFAQPLDVGVLNGRWVEVEGTTATGPFGNTTGSLGCWGGNKGSASDVVLRFTLDDPMNVYVVNTGTTTNSVLQLYDGAGNYRYCNNGSDSQASIFQRLPAGTHHVVWSGSADRDGDFRLGLGAWPDDASLLTPAGPACAAGDFGYPCFREGTIPIAVMFTDAESHNGRGGDDRYSGFSAPAYMDTITAMNSAGVKFVGIHSGSSADPTCSTPCDEWERVEVCVDDTSCVEWEDYEHCWDETYCAAYVDYEHCEDVSECQSWETYEDCDTVTYCAATEEYEHCDVVSYCAEYGEVTTCETKTYCQQGGICWDEEVCTTSTECITTATRLDCETRTRCTAYDSYEDCETRSRCALWGTRSDCETRTRCGTYDTRTECETRTRCSRYETTTNCRWENGSCLRWGDTSCTYDYERSERDLREIAVDTGSVDGSGNPFVYQINPDGSGLSDAVVQAIAELSGSVRLDITLRVNDDPATTGIDERDFVKSISTVSTGDPPPETASRCYETFDSWYRKCLPGTQALFRLGVQNDMVRAADVDQLFEFTVDLMGDGIYVLNTFRVVVLVPKYEVQYPTEGRFWRDYDAYEFCAPHQLPEWGELTWDADVPAGTELAFELRAALDPSDVATADPATVVVPPATPPVHVSNALRAIGQPANAPNLRLTSVLRSSADRTETPALNRFDLRWTCVDAD